MVRIPRGTLGISHKERGFTLVELLVVCAIIVLVTAATLANNSKLGGRVSLENLAYNVALTIRQAQQYGISEKRSTSGDFNSGFGVHFSMSSPTTYVLFGDTVVKDGIYETGEVVPPSPYSLTGGYTIQQLCATPSIGGTEQCYSSNATLDVFFQRPDPDAYISFGNNSCITTPANCMNGGARVVLQSPRGDTINIDIAADGQIQVK